LSVSTGMIDITIINFIKRRSDRMTEKSIAESFRV
jgi:hypothetical protein